MSSQAHSMNHDEVARKFEDETFSLVCNLEEPLTAISDLLRALCLLAQVADGDDGTASNRVALLALKECEAVRAVHAKLFHLTHPNRDHFNRVGWPS